MTKIKSHSSSFYLLLLLLFIFITQQNNAQFYEDFSNLKFDSSAINGWAYFCGDGSAQMEFTKVDNKAKISVNSKNDKLNIWWALIKRNISPNLELEKLDNPIFQLRIEAKIRVSAAPRRVNLHVNTQRTTNFHTNLMEFDIPDTSNWHVISMTTKNFDVHSTDTIYAQLALMDWGIGKFSVELEYFKVDIVDTRNAEADLGNSIFYRPTIPPITKFENHLIVKEEATLSKKFHEMNFSDWGNYEDSSFIPTLSVSNDQIVILNWDFSNLQNSKVEEAGLLELTTYSLFRGNTKNKDFGHVRVCEIIGGNKFWTKDDVTLDSFLEGAKIEAVINQQMIIDQMPNKNKNGKSYFTINKYALQRLIDGKSLGLAIIPLGEVSANFYSKKFGNGKHSSMLHFNAIKEN